MKRTDALTRLVVLLLFTAAMAYVLAALHARRNAPETAVVVSASVEQGIDGQGCFLREETLLTASAPPALISAQAGRRIPAGGTTAFSAGDDAPLRAPVSGIFVPEADGYEFLRPEAAETLIPASLTALEPEPLPDGVYGKLVSGFVWYFAAVLPEEAAADFSPGQAVTLRFPEAGEFSMEVHSLGEAEAGERIAVFACDTVPGETLSLRKSAVRVITETLNGLSVPAEAVHIDPDTEQAFVWVVTAQIIEKKTITILHRDERFVLAAAESEIHALREGNTLVLLGRELYEGKILK